MYKLAAEAGSSNPRLREPLFLYALYTQKEKVLLQATKEPTLHMEFTYNGDLYNPYFYLQNRRVSQENA
jgi:hypothetical protein